MTATSFVVCCDAYRPADAEGGPPFSTSALCRGLAEIGADVRVVTTDRNGAHRLDVPTDRWTTCDGLPVWYAKSWPGPYYPAPSAARALRSVEADCVLSSGTLWTHLGLLGWLAARRTHTPVMLFPRGLLDPWARAHKAARKRLYWSLIGKRIISDAASVVALTEQERDTVQTLAVAKRIDVIPNGIRSEDFEHAEPRAALEAWLPQLRGKPYVLFLGRIHAKKGLDALLGSIGRAELARFDVLVVIAGPVDAEYRETLARLVRTCAQPDRLVFTGAVAGARKAALLAHAEVFVLPSLSEGQPVAVLEALACGTPAIVSPGCHLPEVAASGSGIEVPSDPGAVAKAIARLLADPSLQREMGHKGRALVRERFDSRAIAHRVLALRQELAGKDLT